MVEPSGSIELELEIVTSDQSLVSDLRATSAIPGGATLTYKSQTLREAVGVPETITFVLTTIGAGVSTSLIGNWLYDRLKGKNVESLIIERTEIQIEPGEIARIIHETIEIKKT